MVKKPTGDDPTGVGDADPPAPAKRARAGTTKRAARARRAPPPEVTEPMTAPAEPPEAAAPPAVIVYIPGLGERTASIESFAHRLAAAMDQESPDAQARYHVEPPDSNSAPAEVETTARRIVAKLNGRSWVVADVYRMSYEGEFRERFEKASQAVRAWYLGRLVLYVALFQLPRSLVSRDHRNQKSGKARAELLVALFVFFLLCMYMVILLVAVVDGAWKATHKYDLGALQYVTVTLTGLLAVAPGRLRNAVSTAAADYYAAASYLATGENRSNQASRLSGLLEHIVEETPPDAPIYLVAYSFGSVITLDSLFPPGTDRPARFDRIQGLITVGCPFDLVRSVWPGYYASRGGSAPPLWVNVFAPLDVLGSNFIDGDDTASDPSRPTVLPGRKGRRQAKRMGKTRPDWAGINLRSGAFPARPENIVWDNGTPGDRLTWPKVLMFTGIKAHCMYWDMDDPADIGCFRPIAVRITEHLATRAGNPLPSPVVIDLTVQEASPVATP